MVKDLRRLTCLFLACFLYGYSVTELNGIVDSVICSDSQQNEHFSSCLSTSLQVYGLINGAAFSSGGLVGSFVLASYLGKRWSNRKMISTVGFLSLLGQCLIALTPYVFFLAIGRFSTGLSAGLSVVYVPLELNKLKDNKNSPLGLLTQISIVTGLLCCQSLSVFLSRVIWWRLLPAINVVFSALLLIFNDSRWDYKKDTLLQNTDEYEDVDEENHLTITDILKDTSQRTYVILAIILLASQQTSGINAILYFSNTIFSSIADTQTSKFITLGITVVNFLMTFPPIYLIKKFGKKKLLAFSFIGIIGSLICLSIFITNKPLLSAITVYLFISFYSIGLGPLPFDILSNLVDENSSSALQSIGLASNWVANLLIGSTFLPLTDLLNQSLTFLLYALISGIVLVYLLLKL